MQSNNSHGILMMVVAMALFTLNDTLIKAAMQSLPLFQAIALRGVVVTLLLVVLTLATGTLRPALPQRDHKIIFWRMICDLGATLTFLTALNHMALANISAILQTVPLVMTLAAVFLYKEQLGWRRVSAIFIGLIGVLLVIKPGSDAFNLWSIMALISVIIVCARDFLTREISNSASSFYIALVTGFGTMVMGFTGYFFEEWQPLGTAEIGYLTSGGLALALALIVVVGAMRHGDVGTVAPFRYSALIWAILLGLLFFGEVPDALALLGIALIVGSGVFTLWREARLRRAAARLNANAAPRR